MKELSAGDAVFLVEHAGEPPWGFGACERQRSERLMAALAGNLIESGYENAAVRLPRDNPVARYFCEAHVVALTGIEGAWSTKGLDIPDVAYGWRYHSRIAAHA